MSKCVLIGFALIFMVAMAYRTINAIIEESKRHEE